MMSSSNIVSLPFFRTSSSRPAGGRLFLLTCYQQYNAADEGPRSRDGRQRYMVCLVASGVNGSDVKNLFPGRVRKTTPRKTEYAKRNQDDPKRLVHGGLLSAAVASTALRPVVISRLLLKARAIRHPYRQRGSFATRSSA